MLPSWFYECSIQKTQNKCKDTIACTWFDHTNTTINPPLNQSQKFQFSNPHNYTHKFNSSFCYFKIANAVPQAKAHCKSITEKTTCKLDRFCDDMKKVPNLNATCTNSTICTKSECQISRYGKVHANWPWFSRMFNLTKAINNYKMLLNGEDPYATSNE